MGRLALVLFSVLAASGYSCSSPASGGALSVTIRFTERSNAACVLAGARTRDGTIHLTAPMARADRETLLVGIRSGEELSGAVELFARGFAKDDCSANSQVEETGKLAVSLTPKGVQAFELVLDGPRPGTDVDGDGFAAPGDCDDLDKTIHPHAFESNCGSGKDENCDGLVDCADPSCSSYTCAPSTTCVAAAVCRNGTCEQMLFSGCDGGLDAGELDGGSDGGDFSDGGISSDGGTPDDAGSAGDAGAASDAGTPSDAGADGGTPWSPSNVVPLQTMPTLGVTLSCADAELNTSLNDDQAFVRWCGEAKPSFRIVTQPGGPDLFVIDTPRLNLSGTLVAYGSRPVVFAVYGDATIGGQLVARPNADDSIRPAGSGGRIAPVASWCFTGTGGGDSTTDAVTGGGGGGAFGTDGARGGNGAAQAQHGTFGLENGNATLVPLRGGCSGGKGGPTSADLGGWGGGAIQLSARGTLTVTGRIGAPGGGGRGGASSTSTNGGAGGGGSGGAILLEAAALLVTGEVTANGGSGGEGDGATNGAYSGSDGVAGSLMNSSPAQGANGSGTSRGGPGGNGGAGATAPTNGVNGADLSGSDDDTGCGGGGGGSVGRIRINAATCSLSLSTFSPAPTASGVSGCGT
jgi:hypothetical protein